MVASLQEIQEKVRIAREAWDLGRKTMVPKPARPIPPVRGSSSR